MKKIILTAALSLTLGLGGGWLIFHSGSSSGSSAERKILYYRDPMNPEITSPTPKKAPDGMDYVPVYDVSQKGNGKRRIAYYKDPMHPWYTSDRPGKAPDCGMDLVPVYEGESDAEGIRIDPITIQDMGVQVATVKRRKLDKIIRTTGVVSYDERRLFSVNTKIMGWVEKLYVDYTGMVVREGQPLMELYSPELVTTQQEYLQALRYRKKMQSSSLEEARLGSDDLVQSAKRRLLYWDIPESEIEALEQRGTPKKTMTIYSPADGVVMEKMVQQGQNVRAGVELFKIADLSTVWIMADIYQYELPWVKLGQTADVELSYLPGKTFKGKITYVYPYLNDETKTAKVRVEIRNTPTFELKPDMYATVKIVSPVAVDAIAVPDQAVIRSGERNIVVVALGGGYFDPRTVKLGVMANGYDQVLDGIKEDEKIVVSSQFLIDSESNLKAAISQMTGGSRSEAQSSGEDGTKSSAVRNVPSAMESKHGPNSSGSYDHNVGSDENQQAGNTLPRHENMQMKDTKTDSSKTSNSISEERGGSGVDETAANQIDPVCGMEADPGGEYKFAYRGKTYYFCGEYDMQKFEKDPAKYTKKSQ
jgi:RND family efflux transporter MFP subunit